MEQFTNEWFINQYSQILHISILICKTMEEISEISAETFQILKLTSFIELCTKKLKDRRKYEISVTQVKFQESINKKVMCRAITCTHSQQLLSE